MPYPRRRRPAQPGLDARRTSGAHPGWARLDARRAPGADPGRAGPDARRTTGADPGRAGHAATPAPGADPVQAALDTPCVDGERPGTEAPGRSRQQDQALPSA